MNSSGVLFTTIALYIIVSISATFINKLLFTFSEYKFPYPFFTVFFQLVVSFIFLTFWSTFRPIRRPYARIPTFKWDSTVAIRVAPLTIVYMCVIIFNPLFLQHVETTAYHFSHSLSIAFSILFSQIMLKVETASRINSACIIIIFGVCISSMGNLNFSLVGAFYALAWPSAVAIYGIYIKKTLVSLRNDFWAVIQYNTIMSIAIFAPLVLLSGELNDILSNVWFLDEFGFWVQMVITAMTGFSVNAAMVLLLMYTSPLSVAVASTSKTILQAFIAAALFGNRLTFMNVVGLMIALAGSCYFTYLRSADLKL
ncbi:uncharacterized protein EV154DRAFT_418954 [Mucor mucedo]|uniref:uncharacterized protein n=1 Tax=Mucor mucedo TaxID=29922 RepID=UPI00222098F6|nr:uncharacterized protein EV154DRAFT_418954 [Mucor mucedo]KAI7892259.1 hypothetical protein EV154DRAFT_418954 [Mucor mucedo]